MNHRVIVCPLKRCKPLLHAFDYTHDTPLPVGTLVEVPFRRAMVYGIVVDASWAQPPSSRITVRPIARVIVPSYVPAGLLATAQSIARISATSLSNILCAALPKTYPKDSLVFPAPHEGYQPAVTRRIDCMDHMPSACWDVIESKSASPILIIVPQIEDAFDIENHREGKTPVTIITKQLSLKQWVAFRHNPPPLVITTRRGLLLPYDQPPHLIVYRAGSPLFVQDLMNPHYEPLDVVALCPHAYSSVTMIDTSPNLKTLPLESTHVKASRKISINVHQSYAPEKVVDELIEHSSPHDAVHTAIIVHNKGDARRLICITCNAIATCTRCGEHLSMAGSGQAPRLACDLCGASYQRFGCALCHAGNFRPLGIGIKTIARMFEGARRRPLFTLIDKDSESVQPVSGAHFTIATTALINHYKKGTHTPAQRLVIPDADTFFSYGNTDSLLSFRHMIEECISLGVSEVQIYTRTPAHPFFQSLMALDGAFLSQESLLRARFHYPPFGWVYTLANLTPEAQKAAQAWITSLWGVPGYAIPQPPSSLLVRIARDSAVLEKFFTFLKQDIFRDSIVSANASYEEKIAASPHRSRA